MRPGLRPREVYPESLHGFTLFPTAMARAANERIEAWVAARAAEE